jgi:tape measure domain-containing protein
MSGNVELRAILRDEITPTLAKIEASLARTGATGVSAGHSIGGAYMPIIKTSRQLTDELERNVAQLSRQRDAMRSPEWKAFADQQAVLKREIASMTGESTSLGMSWQGIAAKFYLASSAIQPLIAGMGSLVDAAKQYDSIRSRLIAAEGSQALGMQDFKEVQEMAKKPGLGFEQAASAMATLRGMKVTAAEAKQLILGVAQANASAAGTAEQFGHVMYQIQQSVSLGRLMAEDLRPIMQQIPTLGAAIQEHFGASQADELNKRLKESGKSVRDFWMEVAQLGQNLPAAGETIANNLDNMGDAWIRLKASLADTDAIKSATGAIAKLLEGTAAFFEKKTELRTLEDRALKELGLNRSDITLGDYYSPQEAQAYADAVAAVEDRKRMIAERDKANALMEKAEKQAGEKIARDAADKKKVSGSATKADPSKRWATRSGNVVTLTDEWGQMDAAAAEHARNIERAEAADKRKMESREQERERLRKEIIRKEKEIQGQEERTEKARQDVEKAIAKAEKKAMDERLDRERDFWKNMRETTSNGLAEILIAEQEGASWWSGIDGMRHRAVKAGITGATKLGINWLAGAAGMAAGGPGGAMLGATGMEFLSSFLGFRAGGGHTMRAQVVGEDRAEVFRPTVPGTIYNNTQSTSYNGGITVILPNARSADDIARDLPRATRSASSNRRQTSR